MGNFFKFLDSLFLSLFSSCESLLLFSTIIAWIIGNIVGLIVGFKQGKLYSTFLELIAIVLYPIPYYILGLILLIFFGFVFPIFPMSSTFLYKEISIDA